MLNIEFMYSREWYIPLETLQQWSLHTWVWWCRRGAGSRITHSLIPCWWPCYHHLLSKLFAWIHTHPQADERFARLCGPRYIPQIWGVWSGWINCKAVQLFWSHCYRPVLSVGLRWETRFSVKRWFGWLKHMIFDLWWIIMGFPLGNSRMCMSLCGVSSILARLWLAMNSPWTVQTKTLNYSVYIDLYNIHSLFP